MLLAILFTIWTITIHLFGPTGDRLGDGFDQESSSGVQDQNGGSANQARTIVTGGAYTHTVAYKACLARLTR